MDKHISCLYRVNESIKESKCADFEFSDPREAVTFAQFTDALLPIDAQRYIKLSAEIGEHIMYYGWNPLLTRPTWTYESNLLAKRRYVKFLELHNKDWAFSDFLYKKAVENLEKEGLDPKEFIFHDLASKHGEPFWEYLGGCYFRKEGYAITRWQPRGQEGSPDLCAFRTDVLDELREEGCIRDGCFLCELDIFKVFGKVSGKRKDFEEKTLVLEAESSARTMNSGIKQLLTRGDSYKWKPGYLYQGFYDEGYVVGPDYPTTAEVGIVSNSDSGDLYFHRCPKKFSSDEPRKKGIEEFRLFVKLVVARNLVLSRIRNWVSDESSIWSYFRAIEESVKQRSIGELLENSRP